MHIDKIDKIVGKFGLEGFEGLMKTNDYRKHSITNNDYDMKKEPTDYRRMKPIEEQLENFDTGVQMGDINTSGRVIVAYFYSPKQDRIGSETGRGELYVNGRLFSEQIRIAPGEKILPFGRFDDMRLLGVEGPFLREIDF